MSTETLAFLLSRRQRLQKELEQVDSKIEEMTTRYRCQDNFYSIIARGPVAEDYAKKLRVREEDQEFVIIEFEERPMYVEQIFTPLAVRKPLCNSLDLASAVKFLKEAPTSPAVAIRILENFLKPMGLSVPGPIVELGKILSNLYPFDDSHVLDKDRIPTHDQLLKTKTLQTPFCKCETPGYLEEFKTTLKKRDLLIAAGLHVPSVSCHCGKVLIPADQKSDENSSSEDTAINYPLKLLDLSEIPPTTAEPPFAF